MSKKSATADSARHDVSMPPRHLISGSERESYRRRLREFADSLDRGQQLLQTRADPIVVASMRSQLTRAGEVLMHLLLRGIVDGPAKLPTWLSWRTPGRPRPRVTQLRGQPLPRLAWPDQRTIRYLASHLCLFPAIEGAGHMVATDELPTSVIRRLIFLEATAGWLGQRCTPRVRLRLPECEVRVVGTNINEHWVSAALDLVSNPDQERLLFIEVGRACSTVCRDLASRVGGDVGRAVDDSVQITDGGQVATDPEKVADAVERAYDLLRHYHDLLLPPNPLGHRSERHQADEAKALDRLEPVMRHWLPLALPSEDALLRQVHGVLGDRTVARDLLRGAHLHAMRLATLNRLAGAAANKTTTLRDAIAGCREALQRWRDLQPTVRKAHDGRLAIVANPLHTPISTGHYWDADLTQRPSFIGSALGLSAFCQHVTEIAAANGVPTPDLRPAIHLAHSLRANPYPTSMADPDYATVVDRQAHLATEVELLLDELMLKKPLSPDTVDWNAARSRISARGDTDGLVLLDDLLARQAAGSRITDVDILNTLRQHEHERSIYHDLQPDLDLDASTPTAACQKWRNLSKWVDIFSTECRGVKRIHWGHADGSHGPVSIEQAYPRGDSRQSPELAWARAFRDATRSLVQLAVQHGVEDKPLHRLIQVIDSVLAGKDTEVGEAVREAEIACGAVEARLPFAGTDARRDQRSSSCDSAPPPPEPPALIRSGKLWEVRFDGVTKHVRHNAGLVHIQFLLANPNTPVDAWRLQNRIYSPTCEQDELDADAIADIEVTARKLSAERTDAELTGNTDRVAQIDEDIQKLAAAAGQARSHRSKKLGDERRTARSAVGTAIRRALKDLDSAHPNAAQHFRSFIKSPNGNNPAYQPASSLTWQVNLSASMSISLVPADGQGESEEADRSWTE